MRKKFLMAIHLGGLGLDLLAGYSALWGLYYDSWQGYLWAQIAFALIFLHIQSFAGHLGLLAVGLTAWYFWPFPFFSPRDLAPAFVLFLFLRGLFRAKHYYQRRESSLDIADPYRKAGRAAGDPHPVAGPPY